MNFVVLIYAFFLVDGFVAIIVLLSLDYFKPAFHCLDVVIHFL